MFLAKLRQTAPQRAFRFRRKFIVIHAMDGPDAG
jgi:hypothetical protein